MDGSDVVGFVSEYHSAVPVDEAGKCSEQADVRPKSYYHLDWIGDCGGSYESEAHDEVCPVSLLFLQVPWMPLT